MIRKEASPNSNTPAEVVAGIGEGSARSEIERDTPAEFKAHGKKPNPIFEGTSSAGNSSARSPEALAEQPELKGKLEPVASNELRHIYNNPGEELEPDKDVPAGPPRFQDKKPPRRRATEVSGFTVPPLTRKSIELLVGIVEKIENRHPGDREIVRYLKSPSWTILGFIIVPLTAPVIIGEVSVYGLFWTYRKITRPFRKVA